MSRSPEAKERDRLAAIARRAARKAGTAPAPAAAPVVTKANVAKVLSGEIKAPAGIADVVIGRPIPEAVREVVATRKPAPAKKAAAKAVSAPAKPRGGARKGAGAPTGGTVRMRVITFKGTQKHYDAFHAAGAGAWLRGVLDAGVAAKHIKVPK